MFEEWKTWQIVILVPIICIILLLIFYVVVRVVVNSNDFMWTRMAGLPSFLSIPLYIIGIIQERPGCVGYAKFAECNVSRVVSLG